MIPQVLVWHPIRNRLGRTSSSNSGEVCRTDNLHSAVKVLRVSPGPDDVVDKRAVPRSGPASILERTQYLKRQWRHHDGSGFLCSVRSTQDLVDDGGILTGRRGPRFLRFSPLGIVSLIGNYHIFPPDAFLHYTFRLQSGQFQTNRISVRQVDRR